jgi:transposase, IS5 family
VHFPTDINLLFDAMRKVISLTAALCERHELSAWRQQSYNINHVKRFMRRAQNKKRGVAKTDIQKEKKEAELVHAHHVYIETVQVYLSKAGSTLEKLEKSGLMTLKDTILKENIECFIGHAVRQIDQINRRVILKEKIPHDEKVFSIFEPHTEWISKGKAGVPV